jgi:hypothetical protein
MWVSRQAYPLYIHRPVAAMGLCWRPAAEGGMGPGLKLTTGADAAVVALRKFSAKKLAVLTPYQPVADKQVHAFFAESGFDMVHLVVLKCDAANSIGTHAGSPGSGRGVE